MKGLLLITVIWLGACAHQVSYVAGTRVPLSPANKPFHVLSMSGATDVVAVTAVTTTLG